jgi:exopolysaccharide biosynthesis predicted pyruvyltransferase EpsI
MTSSAALTLAELATELRNKRSCFVANPGNAGDALITLGTYHFFDQLGTTPLIGVPVAKKETIKEFDLVIYGGGGNLVPFYGDAFNFLEYAVRLEKQVVVLPHTICGREAALVEMASNLRLFCREHVSYENLLAAGFPSEHLGLEHDMALSINESFFTSIDRRVYQSTAYCMRTDCESARGSAPLHPENLDISLSWNGDLWHNRQLVETVTRSLAAYLVQFDNVITDRLHMAILGALLGRKVQMLANVYYKNRAVYEFTLRSRFPHIEFLAQEAPVSLNAEEPFGEETASGSRLNGSVS